VARRQVESRLAEVAGRLKELRADLTITDEQLNALTDEADDARIRALVSETPIAEQEHREAHRHAQAMARHRSDVIASIERLEQQQDELLDRLLAESD